MKLEPKAYEKEMVGNFERKIRNLRAQLINTTLKGKRNLGCTNEGNFELSPLAILEVELASWR